MAKVLNCSAGLVLVGLVACGGGEEDADGQEQRAETPTLVGGECEPVGLGNIPGCNDDSFYVDVEEGDDSNDGSSGSPWASLSHAREAAPGGSTICVHGGDYGDFRESAPPSIEERQVMRAAPGETPTLTGLSVSYDNQENAQLTLSGFVVRGNGNSVVSVRGARGVRLNGMTISAEEYYEVDGVVVEDSVGVTIDASTVQNVQRGIQVGGSTNTRIIGNHIVATAGSGIQYISGNTDGEISYNNIHGADYVEYPEDPEAPEDPHASIISFRSSDVILRGNHLHGMGSSSGIMFYEPDAAGGEDAYSNILIENNAIYDVQNTYALRVYNLGENFVVRNNLFYPGLRNDGCDPRYRYDVAIIVQNLAEGSPGLRLYNNVLVGITSLRDDEIEDEANNFAWSWIDWPTESPSGTSEIVWSTWEDCDEEFDTLFEDGTFFNETFDANFPGRDAYDFSLNPESPGRNFGNPEFQPAGSIGPVDANGFVTGGPCRDDDRHSVGPFELAD